MLSQGITILNEAYERYSGKGVIQILMLIGALYIIIYDKKKENRHFGLYIFTMIFIICIPFLAYVFAEHFIGSDVYWRMFWLLPSYIIIPYAAVKISEKMPKKKKKGFVIAILLLIIAGGSCLYNEDNFAKTENKYRLPNEAIEVCDKMYLGHEGKKIRVVVPEGIIPYVRQYNPNIRMIYGRELALIKKSGKKYELMLEINSDYPDIEHIADYLSNKKCGYIVFNKTAQGLEKLWDFGYDYFDETDNYIIYKKR